MNKLVLEQGDDILQAVGGLTDLAAAEAVLAEALDAANLAKLAAVQNAEARIKLANAILIGQPDSVFVIAPSSADVQAIREACLARGEERTLAMPRHTLHFDLPEDQGRMVDQTFYIVNEGEGVSVRAKQQLRAEATAYLREQFSGIMRGLAMYVGFYNRGPTGAQAAVPGIMISSSAYVLHSANILYRNVLSDFDAEAARAGVFFTNVHSQGANRSEDIPKARIYMDRAWFTTYSLYCTYAGNTLLLKKGNHRFAVDLCTYYRQERELSEHMFITGLEGPGGRVTYFAGAAPSGCGKTTTAMVGTDFIGDDLAQMWIAADGTLRAVNPECGIFGIVADLNQEGDPDIYRCLREPGTEVIWSNVLVDDRGVPHWTGNGEGAPPPGVNFQGEWWPGKLDAKGKPVPVSNANARVTLTCAAMSNFNAEVAEDPAGAPIKVITYSGRDADTMPPVWVANSMDHGVVIGASILSAATATEVGAKGVNRQPWANAPFIPGPLGDYMEAQFIFYNSPKFSEAGRPILAGLNYFLTHGARGGEGNKLLGEKRDVKVWLSWLERFAHGDVASIATPIGHIPRYEDLRALFADLIHKEYTEDLYARQFSFYVENILGRIALQEAAYRKEPTIPARLFEVYAEQRAGLEALKAKYGAVVHPDRLAEGV
ncbi:MAG: phosphoenolpyruvate carboxykinase (GTP) [Pseudomonadota bacterium]